MPVTNLQISDAEVKKILNLEENDFADLKAKEVRPGKLTEDIAAFANSDGGELFIGVDELEVDGEKVRKWRGFRDVEEANPHLEVFERLFPLGSEYGYEYLRSENHPGIVLHVQVNKTLGVTLASNNVPYIRRGAQSLPQNTPELRRRLEFAKGITSFENDLTNAELEIVTDSDVLRSFIQDVVPSAKPDEYLKKQALVKQGKPTVAAVLLFSDEPQAIIPKHCGIKVYRYKTTDAIGFREAEAFIPQTVEGCLYHQIANAVKMTRNIVEQIPRMGATGTPFEKVEYPEKTLHEIITNAVIHRDYSVTDDIHIRIFDNRIEVQSPGRLAANMTVRNLMTQRAARNGSIQRLLNKFPDPPNRDVGEGLKTASAAMTALGLEPPYFAEIENSFVATIKHEKLATAELAIMDYLEDNNTINNKQARKITFITEDWKIKSIFSKMEGKKMIKQVPGTRTSNTKYRKWVSEDDQQQTASLFPSDPPTPSGQ